MRQGMEAVMSFASGEVDTLEGRVGGVTVNSRSIK